MTSLDGLVNARAAKFASLHNKASVDRVPEHFVKDREESFGEWILNALNKVEDVQVKTLGRLFTNNPKYDQPFGSNYAGSTSYADLMSDAGLPPTLAVVAGTAVSLLNPTDPLNKIKLFGLTKSGQVAKGIKAVGGLDKLRKGADNLLRFDLDDIAKRVAAQKKLIDSGKLSGSNLTAANQTLKRFQEATRDVDQLNEVLVEMQKRGASLDSLKLGTTIADRVKSGQQTILGFTSPTSMEHLSLLGVGRDAKSQAAYGLSKLDNTIVAGVTGIKDRFSGPLLNSVERLGNLVGIKPKTDSVKRLESSLKSLFKVSRATDEEMQTEMLNLLKRFQDAGGTPEEMVSVIQAMELPYRIKSVAQKTLDNAIAGRIKLGSGSVVAKLDDASDILTDDEKLKLLPGGVLPEDVPVAIQGFKNSEVPATKIGKHLQHESRNVGEYVVTKLDGDVSDEAIQSLDSIFGNKGYARHVEGSDNYIISRRLPFSTRVRKPADFKAEHLRNLEKIGAQLASKKLGYVGLDSKDIMVAPNGAVQIINPEKIVKFKSAKDAVANSRTNLEKLAFDSGLPKGAVLDMPYLKNTKTAKAVPKGVTGMEFRVVKNSIDTDGKVANAHNLIKQASNTGIHDAYVRSSYGDDGAKEFLSTFEGAEEFERVNNVEFHRARLRDAAAKGQTPEFAPIEIFTDSAGSLHIKEGRDRLTAAILEGYEHVPIKVVDGTHDIAQGYHAGRIDRLEDIWDSHKANTAVARLDKATQNVLADNYSIATAKGKPVALLEESVNVTPQFLDELGRILTAGPRYVGKARGNRLSNVKALMVKAFGSEKAAHIAIADIAEATSSPEEFVGLLEQVLRNPDTGKGIVLDNAKAHPKLAEMFGRVQAASTRVLDDMAESGAFTRRTIKDQERLKMAARNHEDGTILIADTQNNKLVVHGASASTNKLSKVAEDFVQKESGLGTVDAYLGVEVHGLDGAKAFNIGDLDGVKTPRLAEESVAPAFIISDIERRRLERAGVFIVNSKNKESVKEQLRKHGLKFGVGLKPQFIPGKGNVVLRRSFSYFVTGSGELAISVKHDNVDDLLSEVYQEGPRYFQEYGVITPGKIILSNPQGSNFSKLGRGELRVITKRLKEVASRFDDLGFGGGHKLEVYVPFDNAVWRSMYGEHVTLSQLLDPSFKLRINEDFIGYAADNVLSTPRYLSIDPSDAQGVTGVERTRLKNKRLQDLLESLQNSNDAAFLEEAKLALPVQYTEGYFGRFLTKKAKEALQEAYLKYPDKGSQSFKNLERFFKGRLFADLTTLEVNEIIKRAAKDSKGDINSIIRDVVFSLRNGYKIKPDPRVAEALNEIARLVPDGIDFFHYDPIYSTAMRLQASVRATTKTRVVEAMKESGLVVWSGSVEELRAARVGTNRTIASLDKQISEAESRVTEASNLLKNLERDVSKTGSNIVDEARQALEARTSELADLHVKRSLSIEKISKNRIIDNLVDLNAKEAWISGESALDLIRSGVISEADIVGNAGDALVRIPISKFESTLSGTKTEVLLFPPEVQGAVRQYFRAHSKEGFDKFLNLWDNLHSTWRSWTLFPIPAYHIRNAVSSMFMAWLGGVTRPDTYKSSFKSMHLMTLYNQGKLSKAQVQAALRSMQFVNSFGQTTNGLEMYNQFARRGGIVGGLHHNEFSNFGTLKKASEFERLAAKHGHRPSSELTGSWVYDNALLRTGVSAAAYVENRFRFAAFIDAWQKGSVESRGAVQLTGFDAAAMQVKRVFYDYNDMSAFEKSWLRRTVPFYAWSRHNIPRMLTTMVTDPIKHYRVHQLFNNLEKAVNDGELVPDEQIESWVREKFGLVLHKTSKGNYLVKTADGFLPMHDAYKVFARGGILDMLGDGMTPFVKIPIEQMTNLNFYTNRNIEKFPGERASSFTLGQLGFSRRATREGPMGVLNILLNESAFKGFFRLGSEVTKVIDMIADPRDFGKEKPSFFVKMLGLALGRFYINDPDRAQASLYGNWERNLGKLQGLRNYAEKVGDIKAMEDLDRIMLHMKLGFPGNQ